MRWLAFIVLVSVGISRGTVLHAAQADARPGAAESFRLDPAPESLVVFKCGPCLGHKAVKEWDYDLGGGHVHPDANHFLLFGAGQWLIRDDGYRSKWTGQHNTLLINGLGQLGEGAQWFKAAEALKVKARPRVVAATSSAQLDQITGDAAEAYPQQLGLRRYVRHLLFIKPDALIVVDDVEMEKESELELRFHPEALRGEKEGNVVVVRNKAAVLRMEEMTPEGVEMVAEDVAAVGRDEGKDQKMYTVRLIAKSARWRNAVAFTWAGGKAGPAKVKLLRVGNVWRFTIGERAVSLNWDDGKAQAGR